MLVLERRHDQRIVIGGNIEVVVLSSRGDKVRLGITAPKNVAVDRYEIYAAKQATRDTATNRQHICNEPQQENPYLMFPRKTAVRRYAG